MKPSDAFLGVIDFFATLVPGAIAAFLVMEQDSVVSPERWPECGSVEGWAVFLVAAFLLGHATTAVGSGLLDPLYDRFYARWRRASATWARSQLGGDSSRWRVLRKRIHHVARKTNPDDELLSVAKKLKTRQLGELAKAGGVEAGDISNTLNWAGSVVRATNPTAAAEIDKVSGQSKLFRSLTILLPLAAIWAGSTEWEVLAVWAAALVLSVWRFIQLRWDATERTYEYFLATEVAPKA